MDPTRRTLLTTGVAAAAAAAAPRAFAPTDTKGGTTMAFYQKGDVRIAYEEAGKGFPLLIIPRGLNSTGIAWGRRGGRSTPWRIPQRDRCIIHAWPPHGGHLARSRSTAVTRLPTTSSIVDHLHGVERRALRPPGYRRIESPPEMISSGKPCRLPRRQLRNVALLIERHGSSPFLCLLRERARALRPRPRSGPPSSARCVSSDP